ncbi:MAG: hypothetical protein QOE92_2445 [Chloroflexota bacterium]|jgi:hypothetical protein|nr:hypothetical protein [Chloroflexota bacterium]
MALAAPVAMAQPAAAQVAPGLLPTLPVNLPTPCVGGIALCGDATLKNPVPCVLVVCVPTPCVADAVLCPGEIVGPPQPTAPPTAGPSASPTRTPGNGNGGGGSTGPGAGPQGPVAQAPLLAPPSVGIVAPVAPVTAAGPAPGSLASLLSLSIGDGLSPGGAHLWPWLAALQAVLLVLLLGWALARRLTPHSSLED